MSFLYPFHESRMCITFHVLSYVHCDLASLILAMRLVIRGRLRVVYTLFNMRTLLIMKTDLYLWQYTYIRFIWLVHTWFIWFQVLINHVENVFLTRTTHKWNGNSLKNAPHSTSVRSQNILLRCHRSVHLHTDISQRKR